MVADIGHGEPGEAGQHVDQQVAGGVALGLVTQRAVARLDQRGRRRVGRLQVVDMLVGVAVLRREQGEGLLAVGVATDHRVALGQQGDEATVVAQGHHDVAGWLASTSVQGSGEQGEARVGAIVLHPQGADRHARLLAQALGAERRGTAQQRAATNGLDIDEATTEGDFLLAGHGIRAGLPGQCRRHLRQQHAGAEGGAPETGTTGNAVGGGARHGNSFNLHASTHQTKPSSSGGCRMTNVWEKLLPAAGC